MNIEIKKISIVSLLTSALPPAIFIIMLIGGFLDLFRPSDEPFFNVLMQSVFLSIAKTLVILICAVIGAFVYNFLCAVGMKGVRADFEDVK